MNALTFMPPVLTMSSLEIEGLTSSRHDSVKRAIERCAERGAISLPPLVEVKIQRERRAESVEVYQLDKRSSLIVVAQLCPEFTARIVDRWQELEAQVAKPMNPSELSRMEILRIAMDSEEARIRAEAQLALAAPKIEFVQKYVESDGLFGFREVAKTFDANESRFREFLLDNKILYRLGKVLTAYQNHIAAGRFIVRTGTSERNGHSFIETKFTTKGLVWVAGLWAVHQLRVA